MSVTNGESVTSYNLKNCTDPYSRKVGENSPHFFLIFHDFVGSTGKSPRVNIATSVAIAS